MEDQKYQCHICMQTAQKPIVTPCGHLFCWQCIYHWLRSNQEYLTCPLCKSGLQLSSVRPILLPNEPLEKDEAGVPPRPRPFRKVRHCKKLDSIPKTIMSMGMNVQRGVMIAGYGIFPSCYQSLLHYFRQPLGSENISGSRKQREIYKFTKISFCMLVIVAILILIIYH